MSIGILYESVEWSNRRLCELLNRGGVEAELINLEAGSVELEGILRHGLILNRLFPSAPYRGYEKAVKQAERVLQVVHGRQIPMINSFEAYGYECSKQRAGEALGRAGVAAPKIYAYFLGSEKPDLTTLKYPCVLKPDCGGRSLYVAILHNDNELKGALNEIPEQPFVLQEYIEPVKGYTTRVEIVGNGVMSILKRYVAKNAISSYHAGSVFEAYPNCPEEIIQGSFKALRAVDIEMGSLDIIESEGDEFFVIDTNATSNFSADNVAMLGYDPIQVMVDHIISQYHKMLADCGSS